MGRVTVIRRLLARVRRVFRRFRGGSGKTHTTRTVEAQATASENVTATVCDAAVLRWVEPCFDALPERGQMQAMEAAQEAEFGETLSSSNTTLIGLDELRVRSLDPGDTTEVVIDRLGLGNDDSTAPAYGNRSLNNEVARTKLTETINNGTTLTAKFYLATDEANGYTIVEVGGIGSDKYSSLAKFVNHSLIGAIVKTSGKAVTFQIDITFDTAA